MSNSLIAMIYGIVGSVLFNVSKGMQRQSIDALSFIFRKRGKRRAGEGRSGSAKIAALYATGFVLNNSLGLFAILANRYAPSSYYTSMFGTGMIALMLYSGIILREPIHPLQYAGAAVLTLGTLILGYDGIVREQMTMGSTNLPVAAVVIGVSLLAGLLLFVYARRTRSLLVLGVVSGLLIGFAASLDPVLKGIGQNLGGGGRYLPKLSLGWFIFLASFLFATLSFASSQWIFSRGVRASVLLPSQNFAYIAYPIFFQAISLSGYRLTPYTWLGLFITILGIVIMQAMIKKD